MFVCQAQMRRTRTITGRVFYQMMASVIVIVSFASMSVCVFIGENRFQEFQGLAGNNIFLNDQFESFGLVFLFF
jgi:hypothetical protein